MKMNRRNISGIYILHKFEDEEAQKPTCIEDCPLEKQQEWINTLDTEAVKRLAIKLAEELRELADRNDLWYLQ